MAAEQALISVIEFANIWTPQRPGAFPFETVYSTTFSFLKPQPFLSHLRYLSGYAKRALPLPHWSPWAEKKDFVGS